MITDNPLVTIVLPIYNEQENIPELYRRLIENIGLFSDNFELIFINDGSFDNSYKLLSDLGEKDKRVKVLSFSRNFGHQLAISAGIDHSKGKAVILMDADLQDPPEILPEILKVWERGADVVYAVRKNRKEGIFKRIAYFSFYRFLQLIAKIDIPLDSGDFCLLDRRVVEVLKMLPERNRFLRGLRSWVGFKQVPFPYERDARFAGDVKYTFRKLVKLGLDGIFSFSTFPLRLATYLGLITSTLGMFYLVFVIAFYFFEGNSPQGWTTLIVLFLVVSGIQMIILGVIGEYIARIYEETKKRPNYIIKEYLNYDK
jgi:dolichol-phosphate mannosyltransferase